MDKTITEIWENQIYPELLYYLDDLNWTFIITFMIIMYGLKHTEYYKGFNEIIERYQIINKFKYWVIGLIIGFIFFIFRILGPDEFHSEYIAQYLRSLILSITFSGLLIDWPISLIEGRRFKEKSPD